MLPAEAKPKVDPSLLELKLICANTVLVPTCLIITGAPNPPAPPDACALNVN